MDLFVFLAVLTAAAFHAGWNALLKLDIEPIVATCLVAAVSGLVAVPVAILVGVPNAAAWPYVLASVAIHIVYYLALAEAYKLGDLGQVYPIARGSAPLMTAGLATLWLGETLELFAWAGIVVLAAGILLLALRGGRAFARFDVRSVGFALLTSLTITAYTLVDGVGARLSARPRNTPRGCSCSAGPPWRSTASSASARDLPPTSSPTGDRRSVARCCRRRPMTSPSGR